MSKDYYLYIILLFIIFSRGGVFAVPLLLPIFETQVALVPYFRIRATSVMLKTTSHKSRLDN